MQPQNENKKAKRESLQPRRIAVGALSFGAQAIGAMAVGALAIGAVAIGRLAVRRLAIGKSRIGRLEIDELVVKKLRVEALTVDLPVSTGELGNYKVPRFMLSLEILEKEMTMTDDSDDVNDKAQIPADDPNRQLTIASPKEDEKLKHIAVVGDVYTILVSGDETDDRYCLIDMNIPDGGGPPPHRHDFEEMFTVIDGEIELTFRDQKKVVRAGETVNIPANAPHNFTNASGKPARMLCMCSPAGQEKFFLEVGDPVESRDSAPPELSEEEKKKRMEKSLALAAKYKTEILVS